MTFDAAIYIYISCTLKDTSIFPGETTLTCTHMHAQTHAHICVCLCVHECICVYVIVVSPGNIDVSFSVQES